MLQIIVRKVAHYELFKDTKCWTELGLFFNFFWLDCVEENIIWWKAINKERERERERERENASIN